MVRDERVERNRPGCGDRAGTVAFGRWGETFSDDVVAAAMIDRLVHHAEVLTRSGDSYYARARANFWQGPRPRLGIPPAGLIRGPVR
jgi:IstB-like ATP binding protein